ncbi:MAG: stage V sporulation protein AC [Clostridia bacterium]|nr:stage V sporulation protein AC [Clostridia bacterium]
MDLDKKTYKKYAKAHAPRSPILKNCTKAFLIGGTICLIGQGLLDVYTRLCNLEKEDASALVSVTLIFAAIFLTAIGVFDRIAKHAGAGTLVPITGFANAVASPAIDAHSEGLILGVGAKIFTVAGPVLLYGTLAGAFYGVIYWILKLF